MDCILVYGVCLDQGIRVLLERRVKFQRLSRVDATYLHGLEILNVLAFCVKEFFGYVRTRVLFLTARAN